MHINTILIFLMHKAHENFCQVLMCYTLAHEAEINFMCTLVYRMPRTQKLIENRFEAIQIFLGHTQKLGVISGIFAPL